jgi:hypothetical protein
MRDQQFLLEYLRSCTDGSLRSIDCGPVWQVSVIAVLLLAAIVTLLVLRLRSRQQLAQG